MLALFCPGPVDTEFNDNADVVFALKGIKQQITQGEGMGMKYRKTIIVPSLKMKLAVTGQKLLLGMYFAENCCKTTKKKTRQITFLTYTHRGYI